MSKVMGIDTASNRLHWVANYPILVGDSLGWTHSKDKNADVRRQELFRYSCDLFRYMPDGMHVYVEEPLSLKNGKTTRLLALAAGAVWAAFQVCEPDAFWHWVDVAHWKKEVIGRGNANKDDIAAWVDANEIMDGRESYLTEPDLYDAHCLMLYGVKQGAYDAVS